MYHSGFKYSINNNSLFISDDFLSSGITNTSQIYQKFKKKLENTALLAVLVNCLAVRNDRICYENGKASPLGRNILKEQ